MEDNRNYNRSDETSANDEQLRPNTTNEAIRAATGDPDADLSEIHNSTQQGGSRASESEDLQGSDPTQGMSYSPNDMSAVRSGGTTDMDDQTAGGAGLNAGHMPGAGSSLSTKRNVTGSDFDGQDASA